jgi:hypothetical protein
MRTTSKSLLGIFTIPLLTFAILIAAGCATGPPTKEELAKADYGASISQEDAQKQAFEFLKRVLKDPDSAKVDWSSVTPGWMREAPIHGGSVKFGYVLNASVNARNSYGAYSGYKPYMFIFFNGTITSVYAEQQLGTGYGNDTYFGKIY